MLQSLRNRLIISHVLPLLVILPLLGVALIYIVETQILLPQLAENIIGDARLLAEISRNEYALWGNPILFEHLLDRVQLQPGIRVMFLNPEGRLLYSSDQAAYSDLGEHMTTSGLEAAQSGREIVLTNYSVLRLHNVIVDVFVPVASPNQVLLGVVRVTYQIASIYEIFAQTRFLIVGTILLGLAAGAGMGSLLAVNIGRPIQQVTKAIYELASGLRKETLNEKGPREIREQVQAVNFLVERLNDLEQSRRQLLANLVHELGRPLGALRSAIHALSKGAAEDPQLLQDLSEGMDEEAARLQTVLEDLAHLHDQLVGTLELQREPVSLGDWLPRTVRPWQAAALEKRLHWKEDIPNSLPVVYVDQVRLAQVIGNLLSNAIKYTPSGRFVSVTAGVHNGEFWVKISDTGPGLTAEERANLFIPLSRSNQMQRIKQGMGLGLSIAKDLAEAHGGRIEVDSTPGLGSAFTLWIPCTNESGGS